MIDEHAASLFRNAEEAYEADRMDEAIASFEKLCNDGMSEACRYLGFIYRTEDSVLDKEKSKFWYGRYFFLLRQRVARGDAEAIYAMGKHYLYGDQIAKDSEKARALITESAQKGLPEAQFHLSTLHRMGWCGLSVSIEQYDYWLAKAIDNRFPEALYHRALILLSDSSAESREQAMALIRDAADLGCLMAKEYLNAR